MFSGRSRGIVIDVWVSQGCCLDVGRLGVVKVGCFQPKIGGFWYPKMNGEHNGSKPYEQMDDLGGFTTPIFGSTPNFQEGF